MSNFFYAILNPTGAAGAGHALPGPWGPSTPLTTTAGMAEAIGALAAVGGGVLYIQEGNYNPATFDWSALPTPVQNIQFVGVPAIDGASGAILTLTAGLTSANQVVFENCVFEFLAFTSPAATGAAIIYGRDSVNNVFRHVTFIDNVLHPISLHGANLWVLNCRFIASASPPASIDQPIFSPLGPFVCSGCEWNYPPLQTGSGLCIGTNGSDTTSGPTGPWWITDCHFLDDNLTGYYLDTIIDIEPPNTIFHGLYVSRNIIYNGKIDVYAGDDIWITDNYHRITAIDVTTLGVAFVASINVTQNAPIGSLHIERNHAVQDANSSATYTPKLISIVHNKVRELFIRNNLFIVNAESSGGTTPLGAVVVSNAGSSTPAIDLIVIEGNDIGTSSVPSTTRPAITVAGASASGSAGSITRLRVFDNRLMGATSATTVNPATVSGGFSCLAQLGWGSWTTKIAYVEIHRNNWEDASITNSPASAGILTVGTLSPANNFISGRFNRTQITPYVPTITSGSPYTNADGNSELLVIQGGAGVTITYRGASAFAIIAGSFEIAPLEQITVSWTTAPTFYVLPV
jgi:hypothetical protein